MANNNVQAQKIESLNMNEAFFMKYKKAIMIAVVALIDIIAGVFAYMWRRPGQPVPAPVYGDFLPFGSSRCHKTLTAAP